jgi:hypothetical protein
LFKFFIGFQEIEEAPRIAITLRPQPKPHNQGRVMACKTTRLKNKKALETLINTSTNSQKVTARLLSKGPLQD